MDINQELLKVIKHIRKRTLDIVEASVDREKFPVVRRQLLRLYGTGPDGAERQIREAMERSEKDNGQGRY